MAVSGKTAIKAQETFANPILDKLMDDVADTFAHEILAFTVGAEAANVINVSAQIKEPDGTNVAAARSYEVRCYENTMIEGLAAAVTLAVSTGTAVTTTGNAAMIATSNASGVLAFNVTDVAGGSSKTFRIVYTPLSSAGRVQYATVTFDGS